MKKIVLILFLLWGLSFNSFADDSYKIIINSNTKEINYKLEDNRIFVELEDIKKYFQIYIEKENDIYFLNRKGNQFIFKLNSKEVVFKNKKFKIATFIRNIDGKTYFPIGAICELFNFKINVNNENKEINIDFQSSKIEQKISKIVTAENVEKNKVLFEIIEDDEDINIPNETEEIVYNSYNEINFQIEKIEKIESKIEDINENVELAEIVENGYKNFIKDGDLDIKLLQIELEGITDVNGKKLLEMSNEDYGVFDLKTKNAVKKLQKFLVKNWYMYEPIDDNGNKLYGIWNEKTQESYNTYLNDENAKKFEFESNGNWPIVEDLDRNYGRKDAIYFSQRDSRWADKLFSTHGDWSQTIAYSACGPSSMSIMLSTLTQSEITPEDACEYAINHGYRSYNQGVPLDSGFYENYARHYGIKSYRTSYSGMIDAVRNGNIVLALMVPGHFTRKGHYLVIDGIVEIDGREYLSILDANHCNQSYYYYGYDGAVIDYVPNDGSVIATKYVIQNEAVAYIVYK